MARPRGADHRARLRVAPSRAGLRGLGDLILDAVVDRKADIAAAVVVFLNGLPSRHVAAAA